MITVVIIYKSSDYHYLKDCLDSITFDCKVILAETIPNEFWLAEIRNQTEQITELTIQYDMNDFSFSKARNLAKSFADTEWILSLDADERICCSDSEIKQIVESGYDGVLVTLSSLSQHTGEFEFINHTNIRMFKKEFDFEYRCHETVRHKIKNVGMSSILIKHIGYVNKEKNLLKADRNIKLMCKDISEGITNNEYESQLYATLKEKLGL